MEQDVLYPLSLVPRGRRSVVRKVAADDPETVRFLAALGILPDVHITIEEAAPLAGPLLVRVGDARYALGREVAAAILVEEA